MGGSSEYMDSCLSALSAIQTLESITVHATQPLTPRCIQAWSALPHLTSVTIIWHASREPAASPIPFTKEYVDSLSVLPQLQSLIVSCPGPATTAVSCIGQLSSLQRLSFGCDVEFEQLAKQLTALTKVTSLSLHAGVVDTTSLLCMRSFLQLQHLQLDFGSEWWLTCSDLAVLAELPCLRQLDLSLTYDHPVFHDEDRDGDGEEPVRSDSLDVWTDFLPQLRLHVLNLSLCYGTGHRLLDAIAAATTLRSASLSVAHQGPGRRGRPPLLTAAPPALRSLALSQVAMSPDSLSVLACMTGLTSLQLTGLGGRQDAWDSLSRLSSLRRLRAFKLSSSTSRRRSERSRGRSTGSPLVLTDTLLDSLLPAWPFLTTLHLRGLADLASDHIHCLRDCKRLRELELELRLVDWSRDGHASLAGASLDGGDSHRCLTLAPGDLPASLTALELDTVNFAAAWERRPPAARLSRLAVASRAGRYNPLLDGFGDWHLRHLVGPQPLLQHLTISDWKPNGGFSQEALTVLSGLDHLAELNIGAVGSWTEFALNNLLSALPSRLRVLRLFAQYINPHSLEGLKRLPHLRTLALSLQHCTASSAEEVRAAVRLLSTTLVNCAITVCLPEVCTV